MRAVISASVRFIPKNASDEHLDKRIHYPNRSQIREAFAARGLNPPPLIKFHHQSENVEVESEASDVALYKELAEVVGTVAKMRETLTPDDLLVTDAELLTTDSDVAKAYTSTNLDPLTQEAIRGLSRYAVPVLTRMPTRSIEDRDKRRATADSLLFASSLAPTRTMFVVNQENEGAVTFRLHHQLIERLQRGCEDLYKALNGDIEIEHGAVRFDFLNRPGFPGDFRTWKSHATLA